MGGHNPMRWDCAERGCFNIKRRPKIEIFCDCFPGNISFGDIDGIVEINGYGLLLEWKTDTKTIPTGQRIMYERLTKSCLLTVFIIIGNAETMEISHMKTFYHGKQGKFKTVDLDRVKTRIRDWVKWVQTQ
jgi:hypothetical protein